MTLDTVSSWSLILLLWVGTPIQFLFCALYFTRKWRKYQFSRALMWKSGSLGLYMYAGWCKLLVGGMRPYDWPVWIDTQTTIINMLVFWAVCNQLWALVGEIATGDPDSAQTEVDDKRE